MNWILENWGLILGAVATPIAWIFGGKQAKKVELKKGEADAKVTEADFLSKVEGIYNNLVDDLKADRENLKACNLEQEKEIKDIRGDIRSLQKQFNDLYLAYAKEVEASKYWQDKFNDLDAKYNQLEKDHESLKKEFDTYKKENK